MATCFICKRTFFLELLNDHFNNYHHYLNSLEFKCVESNCSQQFENFFLLKRHYLQYHKFSHDASKNSTQPLNLNEESTGTKNVNMSQVRQNLDRLLLNVALRLYGCSALTRQPNTIVFCFLSRNSAIRHDPFIQIIY